MFDKGSLEIRCGAAANDAEGPIVWATLLDHLVDFAIERYSKGIPLIGSDLLERGGASLFEELCSRDSLLLPVYNNVITSSGGNELFNDACLRGFRNCQPIVYGFPWEAWHKMIEKEYIPDPFAKEAPKYKVIRAGAARPARLFGEAIPAPPPRAPEWGVRQLDPEVPQARVAEHLNEQRPFQVGDRVSYVSGRMRPLGSRGTVERIEGVRGIVERIEGVLVFRYFVRWDDEPDQEVRWCNRNQLELIAQPEPAPEVEEEEEEEEDVWGFDIDEEPEVDDDF